MKIIKTLLFSICMAGLLHSCSSRPSMYTNENGTRWQWDNGKILIETPERPAGQENIIGLAVPKMEVIRIGFVELGTDETNMVAVVGSFASVPGIQIVAFCSYEQEPADQFMSLLQAASLPKAATYFGKKGYEQLCKRDDIDLVYIIGGQQLYLPVALCALENDKHVAIETPSALNMKECWELVDMSEKKRRHCMPLIQKAGTTQVADDAQVIKSALNNRLVYCLRNGLPLDMNVYDLAEWCCSAELNSLSMNNDGAVVGMPDFTRSKPSFMKERKPAYATPDEEAATLEEAKAFTIKLKEQGAREWEAE